MLYVSVLLGSYMLNIGKSCQIISLIAHRVLFLFFLLKAHRVLFQDQDKHSISFHKKGVFYTLDS